MRAAAGERPLRSNLLSSLARLGRFRRGRPKGRSPPLRGVVEPGLFYVGGPTE